MIDYPLILKFNYPCAQWVLNGEAYEGLDWHDESPKPTKSELDALWESTQATVVAQQQAQATAKASALAKLAALGLSEDEVKALIG